MGNQSRMKNYPSWRANGYTATDTNLMETLKGEREVGIEDMMMAKTAGA